MALKMIARKRDLVVINNSGMMVDRRNVSDRWLSGVKTHDGGVDYVDEWYKPGGCCVSNSI